jgi:hypothetical protein
VALLVILRRLVISGQYYSLEETINGYHGNPSPWYMYIGAILKDVGV